MIQNRWAPLLWSAVRTGRGGCWELLRVLTRKAHNDGCGLHTPIVYSDSASELILVVASAKLSHGVGLCSDSQTHVVATIPEGAERSFSPW